jgi:hypothetical protein
MSDARGGSIRLRMREAERKGPDPCDVILIFDPVAGTRKNGVKKGDDIFLESAMRFMQQR